KAPVIASNHWDSEARVGGIDRSNWRQVAAQQQHRRLRGGIDQASSYQQRTGVQRLLDSYRQGPEHHHRVVPAHLDGWKAEIRWGNGRGVRAARKLPTQLPE